MDLLPWLEFKSYCIFDLLMILWTLCFTSVDLCRVLMVLYVFPLTLTLTSLEAFTKMEAGHQQTCRKLRPVCDDGLEEDFSEFETEML